MRGKTTFRELTQYQIQCGQQLRHIINCDAEQEPRERIAKNAFVMECRALNKPVHIRAVDCWVETENQVGEAIHRQLVPADKWSHKVWSLE